MIKIPRQLIYQDRTELSDYLVGNELNQAIYDALKSIKCRSLMGRFMGVPMLKDDDMLAIFNDAYCLCIEMSNDAWFRAPDSRNEVNTRFGYAWQVALLILSVQRCCDRHAERHLARYKDELSGPFLKVQRDFERQGRTFWADFTPVLPDIHALELDWEVAMRGFDVEIVKRTLRLWPSYKDRCVVARTMLDALRNSPRRDMPHLLMSARLLNRFIDFWEGISLKEWVRNRMEEYDDGPQPTPGAQPKEAPLPIQSAGKKTPVEEDPYMVEKEKRKKSIFVNSRGEENLDRRAEETQRFMDFIADKKIVIADFVIDTSAKNFVNLAFVAFFREWSGRGWVAENGWVACYRFLRFDCGFSFSVEKKAYATFIGKMAGYEYDIEDELKKITPEVEKCFSRGNSSES